MVGLERADARDHHRHGDEVERVLEGGADQTGRAGSTPGRVVRAWSQGGSSNASAWLGRTIAIWR